jgi:hypothetical protein
MRRRRGIDVVGGLAAVHVVERMHARVVAGLPAELQNREMAKTSLTFMFVDVPAPP